MSKFKWLTLGKKTDPEIPVRTPIPFGNVSNGEIWFPKTRKLALMEKMVLHRAEETSRKLGIDRREFLASSMGFATCLAVINQLNGCSGSNGDGTTRDLSDADVGPGEGGAGVSLACGKGKNTPYVVPTEATCEESDFLDGNGEFIFDIQTHAFNDGPWREANLAINDYISNNIFQLRNTLGRACNEPEVLDCFNQNYYGDLMFVDSETTMAVITSWPANECTGEKTIGCGLPLDNKGMRDLRNWINNRALSQRVVNQIQVMPNDRWPIQKEIMSMAFEDPDFQAVSWKCYPAWKSDSYRPNGLPSGYFLTDDLGQAFIQHGLDLCVPNFAVHKGLSIPGFDIEHNQTIDVGPVAKMFPEANFIIYHSGINAGCGVSVDGEMTGLECSEDVPYDPDEENPTGLNQMIRSLEENGIKPNSNVYAELGTAWLTVMTNTNAAQHFLGKLLKHVGEKNIVWGTDSILFGSPQFQIAAFRMFQISEEYQDRFGYPAMTDEIRAGIFGLNAARIFRVDPDRARCKAQESMFASVRQQLDGEFGPRRWAAKQPLGPRSRREFLLLARENIAKGSPG